MERKLKSAFKEAGGAMREVKRISEIVRMREGNEIKAKEDSQKEETTEEN